MGILRTDVIAHSQLTSANASVLFDGSGSSGGSTGLRTADGNYGYALGNSSESITIECWIYNTSVSQTFDAIFATNSYGVSGVGLILYNNNDGLYWSATGFASDYAEYGILEADTWYHVAMVKENSQFRLYLDGEIKAYRESTSDFSEDQLCIGCSNYGSNFPTYSFAGYLSNFRITKRALYKENFTPSKFKLKNISGTTLLCCQDASDDTTAAVGSIAAGGTPVPGGFGPDLKEDTTDTGVVLEDNTKFDTLSYMVPPGGTTAESNRGRGLFMGGYAPSQYRTEIDYIQIQSQGNAIDFGVLSGTGPGEGADCASSTRAIQGGGSLVNVMEYVTIATTSNTTDFGDLTVARRSLQSLSNETRGTWAGGTTNPAMSDVIDYVTIATTGNAADFGNLTVGRRNLAQAASSTRGVWAGGNPGSSPLVDDTIDYITIASAGNATDFGNLSGAYREMSGCSNGTRGVFGGGSPGPTQINTMEYITIATAGNVTDFGDLFYAQGNGGGTSNGTRGIFAGGSGAAYTNTIQYITISTTGNAADFGDLTVARILYSATSDSHGGIS